MELFWWMIGNSVDGDRKRGVVREERRYGGA